MSRNAALCTSVRNQMLGNAALCTVFAKMRREMTSSVPVPGVKCREKPAAVTPPAPLRVQRASFLGTARYRVVVFSAEISEGRYRGQHFSTGAPWTWHRGRHFSTGAPPTWYRGRHFSTRFSESGTEGNFSSAGSSESGTEAGFSRHRGTGGHSGQCAMLCCRKKRPHGGNHDREEPLLHP